uniref:Uncharacterized protein n=1 Tax=Branchiostoma floridae TaxID=7739 RepID=C3ZAR4_BRAFL|eukprot:XP_002594456.1 hypothetical protein BRAFLDRAFT_72146 [Branchiostoma floridae]
MGTLKAANDLLILGQFEEALDLSKNELKGLPDDKRDSRLAESLSVVAVQAFAELNRWQEVLPFVQDVFGGLEKIPPQVLQLCIALHAKMQDFAPITMVTEAWLAAPGNQEAGGLTRVAETYILLVLLPHSKFDDIRALVEGHPIIMEDKRKAFLQLVETEDRSVVEREDQGSPFQAGWEKKAFEIATPSSASQQTTFKHGSRRSSLALMAEKARPKLW